MRKQITKCNQKIAKESRLESNLRILYMIEEQYQGKIEHLESRTAGFQGPNNQAKRKRLCHELAQIKINVKLIGIGVIQCRPKIIEEKRQKDLEKRIQKKLQKEENQNEGKDRVYLQCKKIGKLHKIAEKMFNQQMMLLVLIEFINTTLKDFYKHKSAPLKFATCLICKEAGHISRDFPKNPKGLYAYDGGCYICNSTYHTQANCPSNHRNKNNFQQQQKQKDYYISDRFCFYTKIIIHK